MSWRSPAGAWTATDCAFVLLASFRSPAPLAVCSGPARPGPSVSGVRPDALNSTIVFKGMFGPRSPSWVSSAKPRRGPLAETSPWAEVRSSEGPVEAPWPPGRDCSGAGGSVSAVNGPFWHEVTLNSRSESPDSIPPSSARRLRGETSDRAPWAVPSAFPALPEIEASNAPVVRGTPSTSCQEKNSSRSPVDASGSAGLRKRLVSFLAFSLVELASFESSPGSPFRALLPVSGVAPLGKAPGTKPGAEPIGSGLDSPPLALPGPLACAESGRANTPGAPLLPASPRPYPLCRMLPRCSGSAGNPVAPIPRAGRPIG